MGSVVSEVLSCCTCSGIANCELLYVVLNVRWKIYRAFEIFSAFDFLTCGVGEMLQLELQ